MLVVAATGCKGAIAPLGDAFDGLPSMRPQPLVYSDDSVLTSFDEPIATGASTAVRMGPSAPHAESSPLPAPPPPASCKLDADQTNTGFYSSDRFNAGEVVLTFDDGPHPTATPRVLGLLAERGMPATFFLVGRNINRDTYPLVQQIVREGHSLATHSYNHDVHMTQVGSPERTVHYIRAQHEVTIVLIHLALVSKSATDFDQMYRRVFETAPGRWLQTHQVRDTWRTYVEREGEILAERGFENGAKPYDVVYSRPPGGGPYVEANGAAGIRLHDLALHAAGLVNVMWRGASGDTHPEHRSDFHYLTTNLRQGAREGGVLLIHDYIRADALATGLDEMAGDPEIRVIPIERATQHKYGCTTQAIGAQLQALR